MITFQQVHSSIVLILSQQTTQREHITPEKAAIGFGGQ